MTGFVIEDLGSGVHVVQGRDVNWVLVRDGTDVTVIDSGYPGYFDAFEASVRAIGCRLQDIRAVLITHAHVDHTGAVNALFERYATAAYLHPIEVPHARRELLEQAGPADIARNAWRPGVLPWAARITRVGALSDEPMSHVAEFPTSGALDLPGHPVPVPTHGHTSGHCAYLFAAAGVVATGDALVTAHAVTRRRGPQVLPGYFNSGDVLRGIDTLADLPADRIAPGHGPAAHMRIADAVAQARYAATG